MSALDRKLIRDLGQLKGQVATIAIVVACGTAAYITMQSAWQSLTRSRDIYYERYRFGDVFAHLERAPESVTRRVAAIDGVSLAYGRIVKDVLLPIAGQPEPATGRMVSLPDVGSPPLNDVYLRTGRLPEPDRLDEVAVLESFATAHRLSIGDPVTAVLNGALRELTVVGIALSPEFVFAALPGDLAPDDARFAVLWVSRRTLAAAFDMDGAMNDLVLRLQVGASPAAVLDTLDDVLRPYGGQGAVGRDKQASNFFLESELLGLEQMATTVPFIFLAVAAFLLNVVLARLVSLQRTQVAVLKALGYSSWQVGLHYLQLILVIVVIGSAIGVGLGALMGSSMMNIYADYFRFPQLTYRLDFDIAVIGVIVSALAAMVGGLTTVRSVMKLPPAEAMRPPAPAAYRESLFDRLGLSRVLGVGATMVVRELRRRPLRTVLSSLGIAASIGILVVARFGYDSFDYLITGPLAQQNRGDMTVQFIRPVTGRGIRELAHLPGVGAVEGQRVVPIRVHVGHRHRVTAIQSVSEDSLLRSVVERSGRTVKVSSGLALSQILAENLGVDVGESVRVELLEGRARFVDVVVAQLIDDAFGLQAYMPIYELHELIGESVRYSAADIRVDSLYRTDVYDRLQQSRNVAMVSRTSDLAERFEDQTGWMMLVMMVIMALFAASIAIGVVYNNARVALSMRRRDLASMRVLGFTRREISSILLGEIAVQMVVAIPIGLVLGTWWSAALMSMADPETYRFPVMISTKSYAFAILVTTGAGLISALLVRRKLDRLDLIGVLKTRE